MARLKPKSKKTGSAHKRPIRVGQIAGILALILGVAFVVYLAIPPQVPSTGSAPPKVVIVDELGGELANPQFTQTVRDITGEGGLSVDRYGPQDVTVSFYSLLPAYGYRLILLRVHAGVDQQMEGHPVGLYTAESYNELGYPQEQLSGLVAIGRSYNRSQEAVFAVTPKFITEKSAADYHGALIIIMGCYGLFSRDLPQAFIDRGASAVVGWNGLVGLPHTDMATLSLLRDLVTGRHTVSESVKAAMKEVGPDPDYNSIMGYYPRENGGLTFSDIVESPFPELIVPTPLLDVPNDVRKGKSLKG
jgi:hypothetical protein